MLNLENSEECKTIIPAINKLKKLGIKLSGPLVADTIFIKDYKKYDVIVGMLTIKFQDRLKLYVNLMQSI